MIGMSNKEYRPTLAQLRTFVTIAENRHFGTAAAKLNISQPSLSQALASLEAGLGIQLIERSTRKVIVTPDGEDLLPFAKTTLESADAFLVRSRGTGGALSGPLNIGVIPTVAPYILPALLASIKSSFPNLEPRIVEEKTDHLLQQLRDGQLDLVIVAMPSDSSGTIDVPLYREDFAVVLPEGHHLSGRENLSLDDLGSLELLLLDDGHCLRDQVLDLCRRVSVKSSEASDSVTRASSLTTIIQMVVGGLGATLVPVSAMTAECTRPGLSVAHFNDDVVAQREIGLVYRGSSARGAEFLQMGEVIKQAFRESLADADKDRASTAELGV